MAEEKIKTILENKLSLLAKLDGQMARQVKAIDENDGPSLQQVLDEKEITIESLVNDDRELDQLVALLDEKRRFKIAANLHELGARIEAETEKIIGIENNCEVKLLNERQELFEKMKSLKNGRTLLKGYGMSTRVKPKIKGSI